MSAVPAGMRLLVHFRATATEVERADAVRSVNGWIETTLPALGITRLALPGDANDAFGDGDAVAAALARHPAVESAELDSTVRLTFDPNDEYYRTDPFFGPGEWGIRQAQIDRAWDVARGSPSVIVAVLDTGVDPDHPDLAGALVPGITLVSQPSSECDPTATKDDNSHGTHVAGVVAANGNNGIGIAGVAFGAKVMPIKVLDCTGVGSTSDVAASLVYAVDHGAKVVNLSLGSVSGGPSLRSAVTYATDRNVVVVTAAGNCGIADELCMSLNQVLYPAAYPEVITVGATDTDDSVATFSSRNSSVDVSAPGRGIVSTTPTYATYLSRKSPRRVTLNYTALSGTSQASPFVAGLAALLLRADPSLSALAVSERIRASADDLGPVGRDDAYGAGRINALRALTTATAERFGATYDAGALPTSVATGKPYIARIVATNTSSFTWRATEPNAVRLGWSWLDASARAVAGLSGTIPLPADVTPGGAGMFVGTITPPAAAGGYTLRLDLDRGGTTTFSSKGAPATSIAVVVGTGFGATYAPAASSSSFDAGATTQLAVVLTNTGTQTWPAAGATPVRLAYHWLQNGAVVVWDGQRGIVPADVPPGGTVTVAVPVLTPAKPGTYTLRLDLVQEGVAWSSDLGVKPLDLVVNVRSAYVATYSAGIAPILLPGGRATVPVTIVNTGTVTWSSAGASPVRVATHVSDRTGSVVVWDGARTVLPADLAPGASAKLDVIVDAPAAAGPYRVRIDLVREGIAWFSGLGVPTGDVDLLVASDLRASLPGGPLALARADPVAQITVTNTGIATWTTTGAAPVNIGSHWFDAAGRVLVWDGARTPLPGPVAPGASVTVTVRLGPPPAGATFVTIDLVSEGIAWFGAGSLRQVTFAP